MKKSAYFKDFEPLRLFLYSIILKLNALFIYLRGVSAKINEYTKWIETLAIFFSKVDIACIPCSGHLPESYNFDVIYLQN